MNRAVRAALAALVVGVAACGGGKHRQPSRAPTGATDAPWLDEVVDAERDVVVSLSPRALASDPVWGAFVGVAMDAALVHARERGASASMLEVLLRAEDFVLAVRDREGRDVVAVLAGVPSDLSPPSLTDETGRALFAVAPPTGPVKTYVAVSPERRARIYELPGGTWVFALGAGVARAEQAFVRPRSLAHAPRLHPLAEVRFAGALLGALRARTGPALRPVAEPLVHAKLSAGPTERGEARVTLALVYPDRAAAAKAEAVAARAVEILTTRRDWVVRPEVASDGATVTVTIAVAAAAAPRRVE